MESEQLLHNELSMSKDDSIKHIRSIYQVRTTVPFITNDISLSIGCKPQDKLRRCRVDKDCESKNRACELIRCRQIDSHRSDESTRSVQQLQRLSYFVLESHTICMGQLRYTFTARLKLWAISVQFVFVEASNSYPKK
jgi:hypothetical protein